MSLTKYKYKIIIILILIIIFIYKNFYKSKILKYEKFKSKTHLTCVSSFYYVKNKHSNKYENWFKNTLNINCPYVFFTNKNSIDIIKKYRKGLPTHYIILEIKDFYTYKYKNLIKIHPVHCPSVQLNLIWNEKIFMLQKAYKLNIYNTDYFMWIDAGISCYRTKSPPNKPFPNIKKLLALPKDKFIYSYSKKYNEKKVSRNTKWCHITAGAYILHKNIINKFVKIYKQYLDKLLVKNNIWTEQVILTHIFKDKQNLFYELTYGYGGVVEYIY